MSSADVSPQSPLSVEETGSAEEETSGLVSVSVCVCGCASVCVRARLCVLLLSQCVIVDRPCGWKNPLPLSVFSIVSTLPSH